LNRIQPDDATRGIARRAVIDGPDPDVPTMFEDQRSTAAGKLLKSDIHISNNEIFAADEACEVKFAKRCIPTVTNVAARSFA
jgi:hypothetical protein